MPTLDTRLRKLETTQFSHYHAPCLVVHDDTGCAETREKAIAAFIADHGRKPENFVDVMFVDPITKTNICACPREAARTG